MRIVWQHDTGVKEYIVGVEAAVAAAEERKCHKITEDFLFFLTKKAERKKNEIDLPVVTKAINEEREEREKTSKRGKVGAAAAAMRGLTGSKLGRNICQEIRKDFICVYFLHRSLYFSLGCPHKITLAW